VDEAHYFLHDPDVLDLLDLELNGYTLETYRASRLHPALRAASEAIIVTRESDPEEIRALLALCRSCSGRVNEEEWLQSLETLVIGEAVVLPITDEAEGELRRIRLAPRLTPHVRHLAKYIDIPVPDRRAFVFWRDGAHAGIRARTLREFVDAIEASPALVEGHLRRNDFSRWVAEVFGDYPLAIELRRLEEQYRSGRLDDSAAAVSQIVRSRYEFLDPVAGALDGSIASEESP
jgi:hypothetical protein